MKTVKNKWNCKLYEVVSDNVKDITLKRLEDNKQFTIAKSEYFFSYFEKTIDKV